MPSNLPLPTPRLATFFVVALGFTFTLQSPVVLARWGLLAGPPERFLGLAALGTFGPLLAALLAVRLEQGGPGLAPFLVPRGWKSAAWYLVALAAFPLIHVAGMALYALAGGQATGAWVYPPQQAQHVAATILIPLVEEPGWRGFALPRLLRRYRPLGASLLLGVLWALWHTFMFLSDDGITPSLFALMTLNIIAGSLVFCWLFNRTGGSLLVAILAHAGAHLNNPTRALPTHPAPFVVYTAAIAVVGALLLVFDRRAWSDTCEGRSG